MLLKSIVYKKADLITVTETNTIAEALDIMEDSGFRCVPILDESGKIFRGNIYRMHIYRHKASGGDLKLPVTYLLKNATKFIYVSTSFFKVFFTIKELPYIAVLDENNHFYGILTHTKLLETLAKAWDVQTGSYALTIAASGKQGNLAAITKIIAKYSKIASCITLNVCEEEPYHTLITLPAGIEEELCEQIIAHLTKKGFQVIEKEDLQHSF